MTLPSEDDEDAPFEFHTLDPRCAFVVYSSGFGNKPVMCVKYVMKDNSLPVYSVYTKDMYFEIEENTIIKAQRFFSNLKTALLLRVNTLTACINWGSRYGRMQSYMIIGFSCLQDTMTIFLWTVSLMMVGDG